MNIEFGTQDSRTLSAVCRCCHSKDCYKDVTTNYIWNGEREIYGEMLLQTFHLKMSNSKSREADSVSRLICEKCILRLRDATKFKRQVLECEQIFIKYIDFGTSIWISDKHDDTLEGTVSSYDNIKVKSENKTVEENEVKPEKEIDDSLQDENDFGYEYINYYDNSDALKESVSSCDNVQVKPENLNIDENEVKLEKESGDELYVEHNSDTRDRFLNFSDDVDTKAITQNNSLLTERLAVVLNRNEEMKRNEQRKEIGPFICNICEKSYKYKRSLHFHMYRHNNKQRKISIFQCNVCSRRFSWISNLKAHMLTHTGEKPYQCDICNKRFTQASNMKVHRWNHTGKKPFQCDVCKRKFTQISFLKAHTLIHTGEKPYQCDVCKKYYRRLSDIRSHMLSHTGEKRFQCDVCKKYFRQMGHLKRHSLTHTAEKLYQCDVCKQSFIKLADLKAHSLIHTGEKKHQCDECKKCFRYLCDLKAHTFVHTGVKPFQCDECKMCFTRLIALKQHRLIHTGEKPYQCEVCKKYFRRSQSLKTHMLVHSEEKPYQCDECKKCFRRLLYLKTHLLTHYKQKKYIVIKTTA